MIIEFSVEKEIKFIVNKRHIYNEKCGVCSIGCYGTGQKARNAYKYIIHKIVIKYIMILNLQNIHVITGSGKLLYMTEKVLKNT
jgi:hypothetical protein